MTSTHSDAPVGRPTEMILLSPHPGSDAAFAELADRLRSELDGIPLRVCRGDGQNDPPPRSGAALVAGGQAGTRTFLASIVERHEPDPRWSRAGWSWVHLTSSGPDAFRDWLPIPGRPILTYGRGVNARSVAEWCLAAMFHFYRDLGHYTEAARERRWDRRWAREIGGRELVVLGTGSAGVELGLLGSALGLRCTGVTRSGTPLAGFERLVASEALDSVWSQGDITVVLLPLTPDTRGTIGADEIRRLKPGSLLLVASRGGIVDEAAVVDAVRSGHLAGAAFDVFAQEPLPEDSPLWGEPGILVTPHVAGTTDRFMERTAHIVLQIWNAWQGEAGREALTHYRYRSGGLG